MDAHERAGRLPGDRSYVRVGDGAKPLVVLPGVEDALSVAGGGRLRRRRLARRFRGVLDTHTVWVLGRPRGVPVGHDVADLAADVARAVDAVGGPADVLGRSVGGCVATRLAVRYPDRVDHLVLSGAGYRLGPEGRRAVEEWRDRAARDDLAGVRRAVAAAAYAGWRRRVRPPLAAATGRIRRSPPTAAPDVAVAAAAALDHDAYRVLPRVRSPTLVVGGTADALFPRAILAETADRIPAGTLHLIEGAGHAVHVEGGREYDRVVARFLTDMAEIETVDRPRRRWVHAGA